MGFFEASDVQILIEDDGLIDEVVSGLVACPAVMADIAGDVAGADDHDTGDDTGRDDPRYGRLHGAGASKGQDRR